MSASLRDDLNYLIVDEKARLEYEHERAMSAFTSHVARLMVEQGISQSELARRLSVSRARVSQLMQHKSSPTLRTIVEVANALGCDVTLQLAPSEHRQARGHDATGDQTGFGKAAALVVREDGPPRP